MSFKTNLYLVLYTILLTTNPSQEYPQFSARALDALLQNQAFKSLSNPKTGVVYLGQVSSNLTGIEISALRLRSGSLRRRGFKNYSQISIPIGVFEQPYVERLVLVYHNLGNWSTLYYPLSDFAYLAPIIGLLAYDGANLTADYTPELDISITQDPILVKFDIPKGIYPKCVYFGLDGVPEFDNVLDGNLCGYRKLGHFGIVVEYIAPSPGPTLEPPAGGDGGYMKKSRNKVYKRILVILGCVIGGGILVNLLVLWVRKGRERRKIRGMEEIAESGIILVKKTVMRCSRMPVAMGTRTRPMLENGCSF